MPKQRRRLSAGMSVEDVLKMPISKLSEYDVTGIREITSRLASAGNKRLKALEKAGIKNSAVMRVESGGGKFSVRGKGKEETIKEFIRAREFLKNKFSRVGEWKKTVKKLKEADAFKDVPETDVSQAFAMYDYLRELEPEIVKKVNKYHLQDYIVNVYLEGGSREDVMEKALKWTRTQVEKQQREYKQTSDRFASNLENDIPVRLKTKRRKKRKK